MVAKPNTENRLLSLALSALLIGSLSTVAFAASDRTDICPICKESFDYYFYGDMCDTYQTRYNVGDIPGLTNTDCNYFDDSNLKVADYNGDYICSHCLNDVVTEYKSSQSNNSTDVTYTGNGTEQYTLTVPASMSPGQTATVKLEGTWASNRKIIVKADSSVVVTNDLDGSTNTINITFPNLEEIGDNEKAISKTQNISLSNMDGLFGTWTGSFNYTVTLAHV